MIVGDGSRLTGFAERIKAEAVARAASDDARKAINIVALGAVEKGTVGAAPGQYDDDPGGAAWRGAATLSQMAAFDGMWITKAEYDKAGVDVIYDKCQ